MPITKSSVVIARMSILFFIILLIVNSLILFFVVKRLFSDPVVNTVNSSNIVVTNYVENLAISESSNTVKSSTPEPLYYTFKYTCSNIGKYNRPFINVNNKILTLGDYWDFGRILTITPYRIISLIPPNQFVIVKQDFFSRYENLQNTNTINTNSVENSNNMPFGGFFNEEQKQ